MNRIERSFLAAASLAAFLIPAAPAAAAEPGAEIAGHWLAMPYLEAIGRTRSPTAALREADLVALLVDRDDQGPGYLLAVTSFHEGLNYRVRGVKIEGALAAIEADSLDDDSDASQTLRLELSKAADGGRLAAGVLWGEEKVVYRRLPGTVQDLVRGLTVAGRYRDAAGKLYDLKPTGEMDWGGRKLTYEVVVDYIDGRCDNLAQADPRKPDEIEYVGFRREQGKLSFYQLVEVDGPDYGCAEKPFLILTPES